MHQIISHSIEETGDFGRRLAKLLTAGDVICLEGTLGAGKTLLVQGIAAGLAIEEPVVSPTFTLMNVYEGQIPVYHFDLYRLDNAEELQDIGFDEYVNGSGISLIEWGDKFSEYLPEEYLRIELTPGAATQRYIRLEGYGDRYRQMVEELKQ